ncbi:hypothetical protein [Actinopolymorpha sp. B9G3]|uniref:hypothetical protein n=1 Tax=Actinopolymorpha sp. B9G3 TaxID=3158970 RepID=UPI0032D900E7
MILTVALLVGIPLLLIGGGIAAYWYIGNSGGGASSDPPNASSEGADVADIEAAIEKQGFSCYETLSQPTVVRSCYLTASDGAHVAVRMQAGQDGEALHVEVMGRQSGVGSLTAPRGDPVEPTTQAFTAISETLLGSEANELPEIEGGQSRTTFVPWGRVEFGAFPDASFATFAKDGTKPVSGSAVLPASIGDIQKGLGGAGFACDTDSCDKDAEGTTSLARVKRSEIRLSVEDAGQPVSDKVLRTHIDAVLDQLVSGADREAAMSWASSRLNPEHGFVQGDAGGLHIEIARDGAESAEVVIQPAQARFPS